MMDAETRDKLWRAVRDLGFARDLFFIRFNGAGRDTDLRDALLEMEAYVKDALALVMEPEKKGGKEVRHG